jgi:hypothetical protein
MLFLRSQGVDIVRSVVGALILIFAAGGAVAQTPAAPLLSPQVAFDRASAPVDIIHRSVDNWSDIERSALTVAVAEAKDACLARTEETYAGDDLIAYSKLCALGKQWQPVYTAATLYINSKDARKPQLVTAYGYEIEADLNLDHEKDAVGAAIAMLRSVPYGPLTDEVTSSATRYLQFAYTRDALSVMSVRQGIILKMLQSSEPPPVPVHTLYEHALDFPALEQYYNEPNVAAILAGDLERALPATLSPDESILVAAARRRYRLLGTHFPVLPGAVTLMSATETPLKQPSYGSATIFFLFPPWCAQCVRLAEQIVPELVRIAVLKGPDYQGPSMYALLADAAPPALRAKAVAVKAVSAKPGVHDKAVEAPKLIVEKTVSEQLRKTPTLVVSPGVLADFNATDFPFLIATDRDGIIRLMMPAAPDNALVQGGIVDQMTQTILSTWPAKESK